MKTIPWRVFRGQKECRESWEVFVTVQCVFLGQADGTRVRLPVPGCCDPGELPTACNCRQQLSSFRAGKREGKYPQPLITA